MRLLFVGLLMAKAALADQFNAEQLPPGAEVTLPGAAKTMVPLATTIRVGSTDLPQTIRVEPVIISGKAQPIMLSIFDAKQDRVKYIQVAPGSPFLYSFRGLSSITINANYVDPKQSVKPTVKMQIESDKPLTVAR